MSLKLNKVITTFKNKCWNSEENKTLLNLVSKDRLNVEPCTIYKLDQRGLNYIEILVVTQYIDIKFIDVPPADLSLLNDIQAKCGLVFNHAQKQKFADKKVKTHPINTKLNSYVSDKCGDHWLRSSALLKLNLSYFK